MILAIRRDCGMYYRPGHWTLMLMPGGYVNHRPTGAALSQGLIDSRPFAALGAVLSLESGTEVHKLGAP